jgi:hypothetical protein
MCLSLCSRLSAIGQHVHPESSGLRTTKLCVCPQRRDRPSNCKAFVERLDDGRARYLCVHLSNPLPCDVPPSSAGDGGAIRALVGRAVPVDFELKQMDNEAFSKKMPANFHLPPKCRCPLFEAAWASQNESLQVASFVTSHAIPRYSCTCFYCCA